MTRYATLLKLLGVSSARHVDPCRETYRPGQFANHLPGEIIIPAPQQWAALPGSRIELGSTGFAIEMRPKDHKGRFYWLWSPEGRLIATSGVTLLAELKSMAESLARDRIQFEVPAKGWKP